MFRKMRRFNQQISDSECIEILKNTKWGVLSLIGDDGYPYGLPIDHWYCENDGKIYFHGAKRDIRMTPSKRVIRPATEFMMNAIVKKVTGRLT